MSHGTEPAVEHLPLLLILGAALALLISNRMPPDGVGLSIIVALLVTGKANPREAFAGFSHPAILTVAAVLVLNAGIQKTGVADVAALWLRRHARGAERRLLRIQTGIVTTLSAFMSNTATVAAFLPVVMAVARDRNLSPGRFLLPLTYAAVLGGTCTLIGTSTNVVVAGLAEDLGLEPLGMFEFAPVGLAMSILGGAYLIFLAPYLLPRGRTSENLPAEYHLRRYLTEVEIVPGSHLVGWSLERSRLGEQYALEVLEVQRGPSRLTPDPGFVLDARDVLLVNTPLASIREIQAAEGLQLRSEGKITWDDLLHGGMHLAEAVVPPGSPLEARTLREAGFRSRYGVVALALFHRRHVIQERVGRIPLHTGDMLLLFGSRSRLRDLAATDVLSLVQILPPRSRRALGRLAGLILVLTIAAATTGLLSLVQAMVGGAALMVLCGCLSLREVYRAVDRRTVFLLAGMVSLGLCVERSGAGRALADTFMAHAEGLGPFALLSATYLFTMLVTEFLTNNACAAIMTPIAISGAQTAGLDPRPFAFAVAFASSAAFITPWGYQTNMFVYGPGGYRLSDFLRTGLPLNILCWAIATLMIPWLWPLQPR
jgi:di/tricarboxylate transporter